MLLTRLVVADLGLAARELVFEGEFLTTFLCCSSVFSQRARDRSIRLFIHLFISRVPSKMLYGKTRLGVR
jgi:hypothetical protein